MGKSENELGWGQEKYHITQPTKQRMLLVHFRQLNLQLKLDFRLLTHTTRIV